jgi:hypothetical protein
MLREFSWRMLGCVKVLSSEIDQTPIFGKFIDEESETLGEVRNEACIVFKDNVRINSFKKASFED